jgi:dsDNA-specific endonuclease/ATPase MutS2
MNEPSYQFFTDADFKKILSTQSDIQTDVAVATNDLKWIIENYKNQCREIEDIHKRIDKVLEDHELLKTKYNELKTEMWKYLGMGAGAMTVIYLLISLFPIIRTLLTGQ